MELRGFNNLESGRMKKIRMNLFLNMKEIAGDRDRSGHVTLSTGRGTSVIKNETKNITTESNTRYLRHSCVTRKPDYEEE